MAVREQILLMINEIKKYSNLCFHEEHSIEILNGNKQKNILGLKDILHQIIIDQNGAHFIGMLKRRYEYTNENDEGGRIDMVTDICDDIIEQVNYLYKNKNKSILYTSVLDIKKVYELFNIYYDLE